MDSRDGSEHTKKVGSLKDNPKFQELLRLLERQPKHRTEQLMSELVDRIKKDE